MNVDEKNEVYHFGQAQKENVEPDDDQPLFYYPKQRHSEQNQKGRSQPKRHLFSKLDHWKKIREALGIEWESGRICHLMAWSSTHKLKASFFHD